MVQEYRADEEGRAAIGTAVTDSLWQNSRAKAFLDPLTDEELQAILAEAELLCLDLLEEES